MSVGDWGGVIATCATLVGGMWYIIMIGVDNKINKLREEIRSERIQDLIAERDEEKRKVEYLKERLKDYK